MRKITFVNHASILVELDEVKILSDPWFSGDAFHKGWNLLVTQGEDVVRPLLQKTTHIYLSHEHPDHFSIGFFMQYRDLLVQRKIPVLFQQTKDKRVKKFLESKGIQVLELDAGSRVQIADSVSVVCIKDGLIDSGLLMQSDTFKVLNLNDCDVSSLSRAAEIHKITGDVNWLMTQFSYAAWKGGRDNKAWRELAAKEKLASMKIQIDVFRPELVFPFASFVYFSNVRNSYLNDSVNTPSAVSAHFDGLCKPVFLKPLESYSSGQNPTEQDSALEYWDKEFSSVPSRPLMAYELVSLPELQLAFSSYIERIMKRNSLFWMTLARYLSPLPILRPIVVELDDLGTNLRLDVVGKQLNPTTITPDLRMSSESLLFIFKNTFGFDTLTVNGCFEEVSKGGFLRATSTLGIENLNNVGITFSPRMVLDRTLYRLYFGLLRKVAARLKLSRRG